MAGHTIFGRCGRHLLEPFQFLKGDFFGFGRKGRLLHFFAQGADFTRIGIGFAQFALDGAHLLA